MSEYLNQLLADRAAMLVEENFTDIGAEWWWERRIGGGIAVCQELDPQAMSRQIAEETGWELSEVQQVVEEELGLEDLEPIVLTFEIPGETATADAARMLSDRSSTPRGLATGLYRQIEEMLGKEA